MNKIKQVIAKFVFLDLIKKAIEHARAHTHTHTHGRTHITSTGPAMARVSLPRLSRNERSPLSIHQPAHSSVCLCIHLSVCPSTCLPTHPPVCLHACPFKRENYRTHTRARARAAHPVHQFSFICPNTLQVILCFCLSRKSLSLPPSLSLARSHAHCHHHRCYYSSQCS